MSMVSFNLCALNVKDMVMLQSAFRGHLSREALLKHLLEDLQNKVSYTRTPVNVHSHLSCSQCILTLLKSISFSFVPFSLFPHL